MQITFSTVNEPSIGHETPGNRLRARRSVMDVPDPRRIGRRPRHMTLRLAATGLAFITAGCSLAGSWKTVSLDPPGVMFPIETITLDSDHNYTATWTVDGRPHTSTGRYKWNLTTLEVMRPGHEPRKYGARLRLDGKLVMTYKQGDAKLKATLEKVEAPHP